MLDFDKLWKPMRYALTGPRLLLPVGVAMGVAALLLAIRGIIFRVLSKGKARNDDRFTLLSFLRVPSIYWCVALGLYAGIAISDLEAHYTNELDQFVHVILILSFTQAAANIAAAVFRNLMRAADQTSQTSGLAVGVVKGVVNGIGLLIILSVLGISIAPLLTALGVGGLAVALALKDTLENLFAGIYLITDRAIRVGDFIRLENGQEGTVEDIGWRTIRILTLANNTIILPNTKLAQSVVINFCLPERRLSVSVPIVVGLDADLGRVEQILLETVRKASEDIVGVLAMPAPSVSFTPGVGEDSMGFSVSFSVGEYPQQFFAQQELRKRIYRRLTEDKVPMPRKMIGIAERPVVLGAGPG